MSKKVTVAIPTYNRIPYLRECIQSVLNQTFQDFDIFVFDNASEDPVEQAIREYHNPRIHFIGSEKNMGAEGNLNRILQHPFDSEYLIIFHDDDTMHSQLLQAEVDFLDAHPDAVFVVTDLQRGADGTMRNFSEIAISDVKPVLYKTDEFIRAQMSWLRYGFPSAMYRLSAIGAIRMKPEFFHFLDMVFLAELSKKGLCALLPAPLMIHRIHAGQFSAVRKDEYERGALKALEFFRSESDEKAFRKYALNFLLYACAHLEKGVFDTSEFLQKCHKQKLFHWGDIRNLDARGIISILSILFGSKKIIDAARWVQKKIA